MKQVWVYAGLVLVLVVCRATSCSKKRDCPNGSHENIVIKNNSSIAINWMSEDEPKDSVWRNNGSLVFPASSKGLVEAGSLRYVGPDLGECWEYVYSGGVKQYYFIFSQDTVRTIGWDKISGTKRGMLKRVRVDLDYLRANDFTIAYP